MIRPVNQDSIPSAAAGPAVSASVPLGMPFDDAADRRWQRRAMASMWLAMIVMALGVPAHLGGLRGHERALHDGSLWSAAALWLAWALTTATLWTAREELLKVWNDLRHARIGVAAVVMLGAVASYSVSLPTLRSSWVGAGHGAPMYFDVAAMGSAWLLAGAAQRSDLRRRYVATWEQLMPLGGTRTLLPATERSSFGYGWLAALLIGVALVAAGLDLAAYQSFGDALVVGLAALALGCPCTLGIARSSACIAGASRAAAAGWVVAGEAAFWPATRAAAPAALELGPAELAAFTQIAGRVRWAIRLNHVWTIGANMLALPLALRGPVEPWLPAAIMLLAWALIAVTNRALGWRLDATHTQR